MAYKLKYSYVKWVDSWAPSAVWQYDKQSLLDNGSKKTIDSIGILVDEDKTHVILATSKSGPDGHACCILIPKVAIVKRKNLTYVVT